MRILDANVEKVGVGRSVYAVAEVLETGESIRTSSPIDCRLHLSPDEMQRATACAHATPKGRTRAHPLPSMRAAAAQTCEGN